MRTITRPRLYLSDRGAGEPILFVTGWTISSAVFDPVLHHYTDRARIIAYDHRGSGRSSPWLGPVSMAMLAADAARVIDDVELEAAHVVGLSMGALVALELAVRIPSRVKSLVLIGGGPGGPTTTIPSPLSVAHTVKGLAGDLQAGTWPAAVLFSERFRAEHPDAVAEYVKPFQTHRPPPWTTQWQALASSCFSRAGDLGRVRAPTLVLHGDQDVMSPLSNAATLARGIPDARLHVARNCGHAVVLEQPEASAHLITGWAAQHAGVHPAPATTAQRVAERVTRPFALHAGTLRSTVRLGPALLGRVTGSR